MNVYLDNAATTRLSESAFGQMKKVFFDDFGNPSSLHNKGLDAKQYIKKAKEIIASDLKCEEKEIIFTSGGTESNNQAIMSVARNYKRNGKHIITTAFEHASVYNPLIELEKENYEVTYLKPDKNGQISLESVKDAVREDTILLSVMMVNNEVGSKLDVKAISEAAKSVNKNIIVHCDAIQAYPKYRIVPKKEGIDLLSVSAHKFHGPKGCGFLYVRSGVKAGPIIFGGMQQQNMRSGTENVPGIVGMASALEEYIENRADYVNHMWELKTYFVKEISKIDGVTVNGVYSDREDLSLEDRIRLSAPHIISVSFPKIRSEVFLHALEQAGIYVSSGSACSSNHPAISGSLKAINVANEYLESTLRFSLTYSTTLKEIEYTIDRIKELLPIYSKFIKK